MHFDRLSILAASLCLLTGFAAVAQPAPRTSEDEVAEEGSGEQELQELRGDDGGEARTYLSHDYDEEPE